jgi:hypothetical protein
MHHSTVQVVAGANASAQCFHPVDPGFIAPKPWRVLSRYFNIVDNVAYFEVIPSCATDLRAKA